VNQFLSPPSSDFAAVRDGRRSMPLWLDIDLTTARSIAAGTAQVLNIAGNSLYSDQNLIQGVATVHFQDTALGNTSAPITVNPGFIAGVPFTQLLIENAAQPGYRMRIFYGVDIDFLPGTGGLVNVTGTVSQVDGGKIRTNLNQAFSGCAYCGAVAAQYSAIELWNPAGSGKNAFVESTLISGATNSAWWLTPTATQLATLVVNPRSKKAGGANSVMELRKENLVAVLGGSFMNSFMTANTQNIINVREPIMVPAGYGLVICQNVANVDLLANFEYFEEAV